MLKRHPLLKLVHLAKPLWHLQVTQKILQYGSVLDPHAAFLLMRGMATLGLRVRQQNKSGLAVARFLAKHALVRPPPPPPPPPRTTRSTSDRHQQCWGRGDGGEGGGWGRSDGEQSIYCHPNGISRVSFEHPESADSVPCPLPNP